MFDIMDVILVFIGIKHIPEIVSNQLLKVFLFFLFILLRFFWSINNQIKFLYIFINFYEKLNIKVFSFLFINLY